MDIQPRILPQTPDVRQAAPLPQPPAVSDRPSAPSSIQLHIERIVLDGIDLPQAQRPKMQAAMEAELMRLLTEHGLRNGWHIGGAIPHLSGHPLSLSHPIDPVGLGKQLAHAVYGGLRP